MKRLFLLLLAVLLLIPTPGQAQRRNNREKLPVEMFQPATDSIQAYFKGKAMVYGKINLDEAVRVRNQELHLYFNSYLSEYPIRDKDVQTVYNILKHFLPAEYRNDRIIAYSGKIKSNQVATLEELSSPYYSGRNQLHQEKAQHPIAKTQQWIRPENPLFTVTAGLTNKHIALWQSHGFYYEQSLLRWEWQRARILQTVEDLYTQSYVLPFLVPMLENAGATVALPRERDTNREEVIVDNDGCPNQTQATYREKAGDSKMQWKELSTGFAHKQAVYTQGENPFTMGTARVIETVKEASGATLSTAVWTPTFEEPGEYAVYVSYRTLPNSTDCARYTVRHEGGETHFLVNQQMGGGTWVYLGSFYFSNQPEEGVYLTNATPTGHKYHKNRVVTADAVKFGGGMGNIGRTPNNWNADSLFALDPQTSGYPRYTEGARYWLQWAGFSDTIYSPTQNKNDYTDDYTARGRWVNVLSGGSVVNPKESGYNVPLDLAVAFHTDAGTTIDDEMVGTLAIYTRYKQNNDKFPTGEPRLISRELTDLIQTQICEDLQLTFDSQWPRRGLWDKSYNESRTPEVPSMLLELLSHQNFADMRYGLDPKFKFTVSRAIYKGILRFISLRDGLPYVVQPLAVTSFAANLEHTPQGPVAQLSWIPQTDALEPTAVAKQYIVYTATSEPGQPMGGFDNGILVNEPKATMPLEPGKIYSFKVVAVNEGGKSFPSEVLSVGVASTKTENTVLVINGFDRISAPANFATRDSSRAGFLNYMDGGVPYINDYSFIGRQHDYRRHIPWMDDDSPGFGASYANYENKVIAGNSFDFPFKHGTALMQAGYNFTSTSRDAITNGQIQLDGYPAIDLILGKQITVENGRPGAAKPLYATFPIAFQKALSDYCQQGGNIVVSGAYVGSDLWDTLYQFEQKEENTESKQVNDLLKQINRLSGSLETILQDMDNRLDANRERNANLGIQYFSTDSTAYEAAADVHTRNRVWIDSLRTNLKQMAQLAEGLEKGSNARHLGQDFARNILKYRWMTNFASAEGALKGAPNPYGFQIDDRFEFFTEPNATCYCVESPDGVMPVGDNAWTIYRYADNNISAAVAYEGADYRTVIFGFPLETLKTQEQLNALMQQIMQFLLPR